MASGLIPNRLLFRFELQVRYRAQPPPIDGALTGWTDDELLPRLGEIDDEPMFAPVWCCWNDDGLYIATRVEGRRSPLQCDPLQFWKGDNLRLMTDTRDTRNIKRATRFCQHWYFLPSGGRENRAVGGSAVVQRAREDAPVVESDDLRVASRITRGAYCLEAHLPAAVLNGWDPGQHPRMGLFYILEDRDHGRQSLTIGDDLPWHVDPSLWATAVLSR